MIHILGANEYHHVGHYLTGVGILVTLRRSHPTARCWWDNGLHIDLPEETVVESLLGVAERNAWLASTERQYHPLFAQWGRREPHKWQPYARQWLASMPAMTRRAELVGLLRDTALQLSPPPPTWRGKVVGESARRAYGLGTIFPLTMPDPAGANVGWSISAWQAVLAWEASHWIGRASTMGDFAWAADANDSEVRKAWRAIVWPVPVELRRVSLLWLPRGRLTGATWSDVLQTERVDLLRPFGRVELLRHVFRQGDGKTAEVYGPHFDARATAGLARAIDDASVARDWSPTLARRLEFFREIASLRTNHWEEWVERPEHVRRWYLQQVGLPVSIASAEWMPEAVAEFLRRRGVRLKEAA